MSDASTKIILSPGELSLAVTTAMGRYASKPASYREDRVAQKSSSFAVYLHGVIGEMAFTKVHGGELSQEILELGDGGAADVLLPDGRGVEVKTTRYSGNTPTYKIQNERAMDRLRSVGHGCLVQILDYDQARVFPIYSYAQMSEFWTVENYGYGPTYAFSPSEIKNEQRKQTD